MKKTLIMIVVLCMLFSQICVTCYAHAETFSVRNGISFGMNQDEVKAIEEKNGVTGNLNGFSVKGPGEYGGDAILEYNPDSLAGFSAFDFRDGHKKSPRIHYCFNDDSLFRIVYEWHSFCSTEMDKDTAAQYDTLNASMAEKYELVAENRDSEISYENFGHQCISYLQWSNDFYSYGFKMGPFTQYLAKSDDGYVDIWMYHYSNKPLAGGFVNDYICIEYTFCTDSQVQAVLDSTQEIKAERNNDL